MAVPHLKGKQVLVTGAASGIGRATALAFARQGANLVISDINPALLESTADAARALGVQCLTYAVDVADEAAMRDFAASVHAKTGPVDVLVNNAGIGYIGPFLRSPVNSWRRVLDINVMGVVHGCHFFGERMVEAGGARQIINVASLAGIAPAPNMSAYAASKHAVMGLCDVLAMELADTDVGVTAICPGIINTPITNARGSVSEAITPTQIERLRAYYEANGVSPDVVAAAIVDATRHGRPLVLVGPYARPMYHLKRISRKLVKSMTLSDARKNGYLETMK
ncbi:SDR family NAD(P)-dependent oxidoreductase [Cupriavidus sp. BIS7]|uniref:SDR family NAD(P)-dependent oxidoreductase n=1 Tax=Cupriavidus sp. BIS7 TaxID=1217718 RepID=UPI0002E23F53|nr:SDR family NAD(P)-dependent oxidoreductase [Cupriavidus sp. BIS7]